jgi:hypothetical protein
MGESNRETGKTDSISADAVWSGQDPPRSLLLSDVSPDRGSARPSTGDRRNGNPAGLTRLICRTALELPYQQSHNLLADTLAFAPCSPREIERIAAGSWNRLHRLRCRRFTPSITIILGYHTALFYTPFLETFMTRTRACQTRARDRAIGMGYAAKIEIGQIPDPRCPIGKDHLAAMSDHVNGHTLPPPASSIPFSACYRRLCQHDPARDSESQFCFDVLPWNALNCDLPKLSVLLFTFVRESSL